MNPQDTQNFWVTYILLAVPLIVLTGGPYGWRFLVLLGALAGFASHPLITGAVIIAYLLRTPLRWALEGLIFGFTGGLGLRAAGFAGGLSSPPRQRRLFRDRKPTRERGPPRLRGRRPQEYFPWQEQGDDLPENMDGGR